MFSLFKKNIILNEHLIFDGNGQFEHKRPTEHCVCVTHVWDFGSVGEEERDKIEQSYFT